MPVVFREINAVYSENHTEPIKILVGQNVDFLMAEQVVHTITTVFQMAKRTLSPVQIMLQLPFTSAHIRGCVAVLLNRQVGE
jgi:hypothetical protein